MAHMVKCKICGKSFDRDKIQAVRVGAARYAHFTCKPDGEKVEMAKPVDVDLLELEAYIETLLGSEYKPARVKKQIKTYKEEYGYTYSGMLKTLKWWYDIKGNPKAKANGGIGIIPFIYKDACDYFYSLYLAQIANESLDSIHYTPTVKEIEIYSPEVVRRPLKMFNMGED